MDIIARNEEIRHEYAALDKERKYLPDWICKEIAKRRHISASTVEAIVWRRGYYKNK